MTLTPVGPGLLRSTQPGEKAEDLFLMYKYAQSQLPAGRLSNKGGVLSSFLDELRISEEKTAQNPKYNLTEACKCPEGGGGLLLQNHSSQSGFTASSDSTIFLPMNFTREHTNSLWQ